MIINCVYFVEGACEKQLIETLKKDKKQLIPGKVKVFNCIQEELSTSHLLSIRDGYIVFVFDTDVRAIIFYITLTRIRINHQESKSSVLSQSENFLVSQISSPL